MAKIIEIHDSPYSAVPTIVCQVAAGAASTIAAGTPVKKSGTATQYVVPCVDGDLTIATDQVFMGFAASTSTETAAADGTVEVYLPLPGIVYRAKAKTASLANTQTEIDAMVGEAQVLDLTTGDWTIDTAAGDAAANAFYVVGGNPANSEIHFMVRSDATFFGRQQV